MKYLLIIAMAIFTTATADPAVILSNGLLSSPLTSATLVAPAPATLVSPIPTYAQLGSYPAVAPVLSDYRYGYSSSYNYQDYVPVVNSALTLPYSLPYAYAADWYYRK